MADIIERVTTVIGLLADVAPATLTNRQLVTRTGMSPAAASRILSSLVEQGWVDLVARGTYRLGPRAHALGSTQGYATSNLSIIAPKMRQFANMYPGAGAFLITLRNCTRQLVWETGTIQGVHITGRFRLLSDGTWNKATGRVLVAGLDVAERRRFLTNVGLPSQAEWPQVTNRLELFAALADIRKAGYAEIPTLPHGMGAVAIPIHDPECSHLAIGLHYRRKAGIRAKVIAHVLAVGRQLDAELAGKS